MVTKCRGAKNKAREKYKESGKTLALAAFHKYINSHRICQNVNRDAKK